MVVLAGGMATRMGGVVKALVEIRPGLTFLDARLAEREHWSAVADAPLPLVLMTSYATDDPIRETLGDTLDGRRVDAFTQGVSLRLTPDGQLFRTADDRPSLHATGHGDLPDSIRGAGALGRLMDEGVPRRVDRQPRQPGRGDRPAGAGLAPRRRRSADGRGGREGAGGSRRQPVPGRRPAGDPGELPRAGRTWTRTRLGCSTRTRSWSTPQRCATWTWRGRGSGSRSRWTGGRRSSSSA